jgi:hypothetical protein
LFAYYIGDSFSALIPAVLALIQGVSTSESCERRVVLVKQINDKTQNTFLQYQSMLKPIKLEPNFSAFNYFMLLFIINMLGTLFFVLIDNLPYVEQFSKKSTLQTDTTANELECEVYEQDTNLDPKAEKVLLLAMNFLITFFFFGFMPGIQSYSTLPYGNVVYSWSINLSKSLIYYKCSSKSGLDWLR